HAGALPFYAGKQLLAFRARAATTYVIDFHGDLPGDTPKEKCWRLGLILVGIRSDILSKVKRNHIPRWMVCPPALAAWLRAHADRFAPSPLPPAKAGVAYLGVHAPKVRLYHDPDYPKNELLVGLGTGDLPKENLGWLKI